MEHGIFRVIGLKLVGGPCPVFVFSFFTFAFYHTPISKLCTPQVAVVETGTSLASPQAWLTVHYWPTVPPTLNTTAVCVKPLYNHFNRAVWLVEFIEFYRILGATSFVFYNHSVRWKEKMI